MKLSIEIDSDNVGCGKREQIVRIVEKLLPKIRLADVESKHAIRDENGNTVGWYSISAEDEDEEEDES